MKTNHHARTVWKRRIWAGLVAVLLLVSAEFWMVCRFGHRCGQISSPPGNEGPALSDLLSHVLATDSADSRVIKDALTKLGK